MGHCLQDLQRSLAHARLALTHQDTARSSVLLGRRQLLAQVRLLLIYEGYLQDHAAHAATAVSHWRHACHYCCGNNLLCACLAGATSLQLLQALQLLCLLQIHVPAAPLLWPIFAITVTVTAIVSNHAGHLPLLVAYCC
jgi:hypothetical protein